jgi:hypothetical protein
MVVGRLIVVHPYFITCDSLLQESLSFFMILLRKLRICFYTCLCVCISKLLLHPPCTYCFKSEDITADVQPVSCMCDSDLSVPWTIAFTCSTLYDVVKRSDSPSTVHQPFLFCHFWNFLPVVTFSFMKCSFFPFMLTVFTESWRVLSYLTIKIIWQHIPQQTVQSESGVDMYTLRLHELCCM